MLRSKLQESRRAVTSELVHVPSCACCDGDVPMDDEDLDEAGGEDDDDEDEGDNGCNMLGVAICWENLSGPFQLR